MYPNVIQENLWLNGMLFLCLFIRHYMLLLFFLFADTEEISIM